LYYYLQVLKQIFVSAGPPTSSISQAAPGLQQVVLGILALAIIILGCLPEWLISRLSGALNG